ASVATADLVALDVTVGTAQRHYDLPRTPGKTRDTFEVTFHSYPAGATLFVVATATRNGQTVGSGQAAQTLRSKCSPLSLTLAAAGALADGDAGGAGDLAGGTDTPGDLSLSPSDQAAPADLAPTVPVLVFN